MPGSGRSGLIPAPVTVAPGPAVRQRHPHPPPPRPLAPPAPRAPPAPARVIKEFVGELEINADANSLITG